MYVATRLRRSGPAARGSHFSRPHSLLKVETGRRPEMRSRVTGSLFIVAILALCLATEAAAQGKSPRLTADGAVIVPITGVTSTGGAFKGLFALQRFASGADGGIVAVGAISGTVTAATGDVVGTVLTGPVSLSVADPRLTGWTPGRSHQKAAWN